jgi:hypothetical protein
MISKTNNGREFPVAGDAAKRNLLVDMFTVRPETVLFVSFSKPQQDWGFSASKKRSNRLRALLW